MANPFGLDQFIAEIGKGGIAKPSNFYVMITSAVADRYVKGKNIIGAPSLKPGAKGKEKEKLLPLRIDSVNIPGRSLETITRRTVGRPRQIPMMYTMLPLQISVILSEDMWERQYFLAWQDHFIGNLRAAGTGKETQDTLGLGYYDGGVGTIEVFQFAESPSRQKRVGPSGSGVGSTISDIASSIGLDPKIATHPLGFNLFGIKPKNVNIVEATKITFHEVYPVTVNDVAMNWNDEGALRLTVEMRYAYFTEDHRYLDKQAADDKSGFRRAMEGLNRFIPAISLIKNVGVIGAAKSIGRSGIASTDSLLGTGKSLNPFS